MHQHHIDSIEKMREYYRANPEIRALFLIGSVATGTERPDSDLDGVAVVSEAYLQEKIAQAGSMEVTFGHCTYPEGYFDIHFMTKDQMRELAVSGSEPMRNMFDCAQPLFCDDEELLRLAKEIHTYPKAEKAEKLKKYYCTFKMFHTYYWKICKPEGFARAHIADGMVYNLYRLVLVENELLFPSFRKLEARVMQAKNLPDGLIERCHHFLDTLSDEDAQALIDLYESWTSYDYPKKHAIVSNNFSDPYDW